MSQVMETMSPMHMPMHGDAGHVLRRTIIIGLTGFLTVVDLFATQAILPSLAVAYKVSPAAMGLAVHASTMGMPGGGPRLGVFNQRSRRGVGDAARPLS